MSLKFFRALASLPREIFQALARMLFFEKDFKLKGNSYLRDFFIGKGIILGIIHRVGGKTLFGFIVIFF